MNQAKFIFLLCLLGLLIPGYSQTQSISGMVTDQADLKIIAASVKISGTNIGTITDVNGNFVLDVPLNASTLTISYIGKETKIVEIERNLLIVLNESNNVLDDILVTGYSTQKRKDVTGSISTVDLSDLDDIPLPAVTTALQGRTSGVQVTKSSGTPGGGIDVRIRGSTSINASNQPLFIVDGIPIIDDNTDFTQEEVGNANLSVLSDLNPAEIESMEVLKDAASAAIYGSRAANGVVLITTKKGKSGKSVVNLNSSYGFQSTIKKIQVVDGPTYLNYLDLLFGANIVGTEANNNWQDLIFRNSPIENYGLNISGGSDETRYFASMGYDNDEGIIVGSQFQRFSGRLNLDQDVSEKLTFSMNMGYSYTITDQIRNDNNIYGGLSTAILLPPVIPVFNDDGSYGTAFGLENPVAATTEYDNQVDRNKLLAKIAGQYKITENLSLRSSIGVDVMNIREDVFEPRVLQSSATGRAVLGQIKNTRFINENIISYDQDIGDHLFSILGGLSFQEDKLNSSLAEAVDFPTDEFTGLTSGAKPLTTNGSFSGDNLRSYFGSANYNFDSKYYVNASFRADGSSRFINQKWGYFPGVSAAWRISSEKFLQEGPFDELKLRIGWGKTGNNSIGDFSARNLFGSGNNYLDVPGTAPSQLGNPDLKWETTTQFNIGLDLGFFNDRLISNLEYYKKNTNDLLLNRPIPTTSGFTSVLQNIGEVQNEGFEFSLASLNISKSAFTWRTKINAGYNKNEVVKLVDGIPIDLGFASRIAEGQPIGSFFGRVTDGLFQNENEINAHASQPNAAPGDIRFKDISGGAGLDGVLGTEDDEAPDGVINDNDRDYIGKAIPDWTGGFSNTLSYKGFDFDSFFQFATGFEIYNNNLAFAEGLNSVFAPTLRSWENRWKQEGDLTNIPRAVNGDPNGNRLESNRFTEQGDYMRLKTITLGYSLSPKVLEKMNIRKLRFYATGFNLWTITNYSWFDPEVSTFDVSNGSSGTDFLTFPQPKSYVFGLNLGF